MKNNEEDSPKIKKNLFKLKKKCKKDINELISKNKDSSKSIKYLNIRNKKDLSGKNKYKLNSFLSETAPLQKLINQIDFEKKDFSTNINSSEEPPLLSNREKKNIIPKNNNTNKNEIHDTNLSKNIADIIKRRITGTKIESIKNKIKRMNKNKQKNFAKSRTITMKELKKNINNENLKNPNKNSNNINERNNEITKNLNDDNINKKYFETRRLSSEWGKDEDNEKENTFENNINKDNDKEESNILDLNVNYEEKGKENNLNNSNLKISKRNSFKNPNYDFDSFFEEDNNKSQNKINILYTDNNSNSKNKTITDNINNQSNKNEKSEKNNLILENATPSFISISNFKNNIKDINESEINENINKDNNKSDKIDSELNNKKNTDLENKDDIVKKDISKSTKDKLEIENIQKIISNTVESINTNLNPKFLKNHISSKEIPISSDNLNKNSNIYTSKKIKGLLSSLNNNNKKENNIITYSRKKIKAKNFSTKASKSNNKVDKNKLNSSFEGVKIINLKNLLTNDNIFVNNNTFNNSFIKHHLSNKFFSLNNCCYNLNNNTNNIFYEITSPSSEFLLGLKNNSINSIKLDKYNISKINNSFMNHNMININSEPIYQEKININNTEKYKTILNNVSFEDFIILDNKLADIRKSLSSKKIIINECFEYLNYFYNSSLYKNLKDLLENKEEWKYINICIFCKLISIIICYECSLNINIFEQTHLLLKEMMNLNYKNTMLIYKYIFENIIINNDININNNIWLLNLKNLLVSFENMEQKNDFDDFLSIDNINEESPFLQKIKISINFIKNNINLILTNIKLSNIAYLQNLFKHMNNIPYQNIFNIFFTFIIHINNIQSSIPGQAMLNFDLYKGNMNNNKILIPYIKTKNLKQYSLVLDLEETILHLNIDKTNNSGGFVDIRPGTRQFLDEISNYYELILFNEGEKEYTDLLIDTLEENKIYFEHRLYRENIIIDNNDIVKDLVRIGRNLDKILIVDNMKQNFKYQKDNGILIKSFYGEEEGKGEHVLEDLANILIKIAQDGGDIRNGLIKYKNEIINKVTLGT